jgi:hypothetical protein
LSAALSNFRRLVASLMLVAMASLVIHGGAMAGGHQHGLASSECAPHGPAAHVHTSAARDHPAGHVHQPENGSDGVAHHAHAMLDTTDAGDPGSKAKSSTCCASVCAVALVALGFHAIYAPIGIAVERLPTSQNGTGTCLDGLKRPPRTPAIA